MPSGVKDIQLLELKDTISQLNKTISTQNELISSLQKMLEERNAKDSEKDLLIANLQSQLAYLKNKVFGSTSEIRHDQLDGQLNLFGTPVGDEKPAEVIEPEVISVKGYTKERKPKATYDDKYNSVRSICKHFFTDIVGLSIKFFCVSLRHMSIKVRSVFWFERTPFPTQCRVRICAQWYSYSANPSQTGRGFAMIESLQSFSILLSTPIVPLQPIAKRSVSTSPSVRFLLPRSSAHSGYAPSCTSKSAPPTAPSLAEVSPTKYIRFRPNPPTSAKS